jgi:hypothetical protein
VPIPIVSKSTPPKSSRVENDPALEVRRNTISGGNGAVANIDSEDSESDLSDLDGLSDTPELQQAASSLLSKIPKPPGEAGRPKSFNLEETLSWPKEYFNDVQVRSFN